MKKLVVALALLVVLALAAVAASIGLPAASRTTVWRDW